MQIAIQDEDTITYQVKAVFGSGIQLNADSVTLNNGLGSTVKLLRTRIGQWIGQASQMQGLLLDELGEAVEGNSALKVLLQLGRCY